MALLGVDTGGTFTDFVLMEGDRVRLHKVLSTPSAPERAILQGIHDLGVEQALVRGELRIVHGTTVATNAALEGKGARTLFITNAGLQDVLAIGRQARPELYNLSPDPPDRPFASAPTLGVPARLDARGEEVTPLTEADLDQLLAQVRELAPESVAVSLLFSWLDDTHERRIGERLAAAGLPVSLSSEVLPVSGEYERGVATWLNAWLGPLVGSYLARLRDGLAGARLSIMQSHGGTLRADAAAERAVNLLLSGPAGGLCAAREIGQAVGLPRLMTFDMGGTSTDVALVDGEIRLTLEGRIRDFPVAVPMVDMHTIGAGGGSLASVDAAGMLHVGPASAGADPGPACYGRGGTRVTVTDANLLLGRLPVEAALGGSLKLDRTLAEQALTDLGEQLGCDALAAARGVVALANEHMTQALRVISVQRGLDPADFTLMSFGGAGGLHVCDLADSLRMSRALVPANGGVLSAQGLVWAPPQRERIQALPPQADADAIEAICGSLAGSASAELAAEGIEPAQIQVARQLDMCYAGQSFALSVPYTGDLADAEKAFHALHERQYGHRLTLPVERVNVRVRAWAEQALPPLPDLPAHEAAPIGAATVADETAPVPVYRRADLGAGQQLTGPALVIEPVATTWLAPGWSARVHAAGHLLLERH